MYLSPWPFPLTWGIQSSYPGHRRPEEGRVRRASQVPVRPPGVRCRFPGPCEVGGGHRGGVGQPRDAALGPGRLEERPEEAPSQNHPAGRAAVRDPVRGLRAVHPPLEIGGGRGPCISVA